MMAIGALMALKRHGIAVPEQVAVAGFDDIPLARLVSPALTSVAIDIAAMGARAVAQLAAQIAGAREASSGEASTGADEVIVPHLMVRETTRETDRG